MNKLQADQLRILRAAGQGELNVLFNGNSHEAFFKWMQLAHDLIDEECRHELLPAIRKYVSSSTQGNLLEVVDGAIDTVVVVMHLLNTLGIDFQSAWDEIQRSNLSKINPDTGKVDKAPNGKWLKPPTFSPAVLDLQPYDPSIEV